MRFDVGLEGSRGKRSVLGLFYVYLGFWEVSGSHILGEFFRMLDLNLE